MAGIWHERNDAMKMKAVFVLAAGLALAAGAWAGVPQVLTYRGVLERPQGSEAGAMELTFRIYAR